VITYYRREAKGILNFISYEPLIYFWYFSIFIYLVFSVYGFIKKLRTSIIVLPLLFIFSPLMVDGAFGLMLGIGKKSNNVLDIIFPILIVILAGYKVESMK